MLLELLGMAGISWGIKKAADGVQSATNTAARKATRAASKAVDAAGEFLDQTATAKGRAPLERNYDFCGANPLRPHDDEVTGQDGAMTFYRCKRCKRTSRSIE